MVSHHKLVDALYDGAVVSKEEVPLDPQGRLARIIERIKKEYQFNKPDLKIDKKIFEKIKDPTSHEKLLFDSLCNAKVKDGALENIEMSLYGANGYRSVFLRSCHFDIFELLLDTLNLEYNRNNNRLILGSPGIGMSWFHVLCLYVLIKANAPVCLQRNDHIILFYKGEVYSSQIDRMCRMKSSNMWFLYDRNEDPIEIPPGNICIFVSSILNRKAYKEYAKECSYKMDMPLWTYTELLHANRVRRADRRLSEQNLLQNYLLCGGSSIMSLTTL